MKIFLTTGVRRGLLPALLAFAMTAVLPAAEIHDAARAGDLAKVKELLAKDPSLVNALDGTRAIPLHSAAREGRLETAAYLLEKESPVDLKDGQGRTPLWWAAWSRNVDMARLLVDRGADINAEDNDRWTPLMQAAFRGGADLVDFLLGKGAALPPARVQADPRIYMLQTFAAENGLVGLMNRLISSGADFRWKDEAGNTLLMKAAASGSSDMIEIFAKAGMSVQEANAIGWTPLHYAAEKGIRPAVDKLLSLGALLDVRTTDGKTAFNIAREWGMSDVADLLAAKGADRSEPRFPVLTGPYLGQAPPGKTPVPFALGLVAGRYAFHGSVVFTPDGTEAYWSVQNFGSIVMAALESRLVNERWTPPGLASFAALGRTDDVPFVSPDGRKLFFVSNRPLNGAGAPGKENIWVMERRDRGWSDPRPLPPVVNSVSLHWQVSVDRQGNLYFGGSIDGRNIGMNDIYRASYVNGSYGSPENLGPAINGPGLQHSPFIAPDGSYLFFTKNVPQTGLNCLHISFRKSDGTWTRAREINSLIRYRTQSMCPWVTPDGKYLFFLGIISGENMPYWVEADFIEELRKTELLPSAAAIIGDVLEKDGLPTARAKFDELRAQPGRYGYNERDFNALGYRLMNAGNITGAVEIFRMTVEAFPESANAYDSLGEGYLAARDYENARKYYALALAKSPNSQNPQRMLATLDVIFQRIEQERKITFRSGESTGLFGPYLGQNPPGMTPELFAPGIISRLDTGDYACSFSPDGAEFYFTRNPLGEGPQVIMVSRLKKDGWAAPEPVTFSAGFSAHEPHVTADNQKIYWGWFRPVPKGEVSHVGDYGLFVSDRTASGWSEGRYIGQGMFVSTSRNGRFYLTDHSTQGSGYLAVATLTDGRITKRERILGALEALRPQFANLAHPCIAPDESYLLFDVEGGSHLYVSFRGPDGAWGDPIDLTRHGFERSGGIASISPDGKYIFFSNNGDIFWVQAKAVEDLKPGDGLFRP